MPSSETDLKFCIDCKHEIQWNCCRGYEHEPERVSLVTGRVVESYLRVLPPVCTNERHSIWPWRCGKKARFFEPRSESN